MRYRFGSHIFCNQRKRDRFLAIRTHLHFVDVTNHLSNNKSKFWNVQPLIEVIRNACRNITRSIGLYSINEQMVPFTGRCFYRQFVKNKPRFTGLKTLWLIPL